MTLWQRLSNWMNRGRAVLASIVAGSLPAARASEDAGWDLIASGSGPADRPWPELREDLTDALEAWRRNFIIRRMVVITTSYVVGSKGIGISSKRRIVERFIRRFWSHRENRLRSRLSSWCDEITRSGDLFVAVSVPSEAGGLAFVRAIPASCIQWIETDGSDYERELEFRESVPGQMEPRVWKSRHTAGIDEPVLLHFAFNRVVGATRGESDLMPVLPLAFRYTDWLKGRVRFNKLRAELSAVDVEVDDDSQVEAKRQQYQATPPMGGSIFVHGRGERLNFPSANIDAGDAAADGLAQRMAISAGSNYPLHFFGEPQGSNRATAKEMGGPTHAFLEMRQADLGEALIDLCDFVYRRAAEAGYTGLPAIWGDDLRIEFAAPDVSEADNQLLAVAAKDIVTAFAEMRKFGWITDELAVGLCFKFFGEILSKEDIDEILDWAAENDLIYEDDDEGEDGGEDEGEDQLAFEISDYLQRIWGNSPDNDLRRSVINGRE